MRHITFIIILALLFVLTTTQTNANPIPIENASFELPMVDPNAFPVLRWLD